MNKIIIIIAIFLAATGFSELQAQQALVSSGGNANGSNGKVSWSVGQVAYTSIENANGSVNQGVQQPFEFFTVGVDESKDITLSMTVYPNPTSDKIILKVGTEKFENSSYQLNDFNGKLLVNQKLTGVQTSISMENFPPASYILKVTYNGKEQKTFKIIKN